MHNRVTARGVVLALLLAAASPLLAGCNTVAGAGKDVSQGGQAVGTAVGQGSQTVGGAVTRGANDVRRGM